MRNNIINKTAKLGKNTKVWYYTQIRENVIIGDDCIIGKNVYIDCNVRIGNNCKIQNNVSIYDECIIEDNVFVGPHVCFTNDKYPKANGEWTKGKILIRSGASIGANSTLVTGITIGKNSLVGAGSVVTKDVPDNSLVYGNPAKLKKRKVGIKHEEGES